MLQAQRGGRAEGTPGKETYRPWLRGSACLGGGKAGEAGCGHRARL